jgi:nucleotide-binding universal stress UspA family protein
MLSVKHILVATDFGPISIVALRHALGIARRYHSAVSLLHVIDPSVYGLAGPDGISADTENSERDLERVEASLRNDGSLEGLRFDSRVSAGPVWQRVADTIDEKRSALLVLGTHGRTGFGKLVLGSVAESAFREAPCPVLTVGPKALRSKSSGAQAKHFLVPTDLSPESISALPYGVSLASATGGDLTLLHVVKSGVGVASVAELESRLRKSPQMPPGTEMKIHFAVQTGPVAKAIVRIAEDNHLDMIVMGLRAWASDGPPMWRTAYSVVTQSPCPVLSMKTEAAYDSST